MLIVADENMPLLDEFFGELGHIRRVPGRGMSAADVAGADLLLVRSVTRVDAALLGAARPRFVGTATIGTDHVDQAALRRLGIPFAAAPGCNALAVAEYVATVLALRAAGEGAALAGTRLGIVGCGQVGTQVLRLARALGLDCAVCDPLLPAAGHPPDVPVLALDDLLAWADVLTLHVPLTDTGAAPTRHLIDRVRLRAGRWQLLINTARGGVVDDAALSVCLEDLSRRAVLDVWEQEPVVPADLLSRVWLGTPHVAGYSAEGKWRGTGMLRVAVGQALGVGPGPSLADILSARGDVPSVLPWQGSLADTLAACCPVPADDCRLRQRLAPAGRAVPAMDFDHLRKTYPERREFSHYRVTETPRAARGLLSALGFIVEND